MVLRWSDRERTGTSIRINCVFKQSSCTFAINRADLWFRRMVRKWEQWAHRSVCWPCLESSKPLIGPINHRLYTCISFWHSNLPYFKKICTLNHAFVFEKLWTFIVLFRSIKEYNLLTGVIRNTRYSKKELLFCHQFHAVFFTIRPSGCCSSGYYRDLTIYDGNLNGDGG